MAMTMTRAEARELRFDESEEELLARASGPPDAVTQEPLSVLDVAAAILDERSPLDTWKLQKLCYYAQARHIASGHGRLFREDIEAWAAGPVVRELYEQHRGRYSINTIGGGDLSTVRARPAAVETLRSVLAEFGDWSGDQLSELTHREAPWVEARAGIPPQGRSTARIPLASIARYYRMLDLIPADEQ